MEIFLEDAHEKATDTKVLLSNYAADNTTEVIRCKKCQEIGHKKSECPKNTIISAGAKVEDDSVMNNEKEKLRKMFGKCPLCKSSHTYRRKKDG